MSTDRQDHASADLHSRIASELSRRLEVAKAASQNRHGSTPTGEHWQWECSNCDSPIFITDVVLLDELLECPNPACASSDVDLRSIEEYGPTSVGDLPHLVTHSTSEMRPVDALQLLLHDPADSIRRYSSALRVLERHAIIHRNIGWLEPDDGELVECSAELPVCGTCVPKHSHFRTRAEVPEGACIEVRDVAASLGLDTEGSTTDG